MSAYYHVYILSDAEHTPIYVGITNGVQQRLAEHRRYSPWFGEVASERTEGPFTREEAADRERALVGELQPRHNTYLRNAQLTHDRALRPTVTKSFCLSRHVAEALVQHAKHEASRSQSSVVEEALVAYLGILKPLAA